MLQVVPDNFGWAEETGLDLVYGFNFVDYDAFRFVELLLPFLFLSAELAVLN